MGIVHRPKVRHRCAMGWTTTEVTQSKANQAGSPFAAGTRVAHPPHSRDYPPGAIWECEECGKTYRVCERIRGWPGMVRFEREGRIARWWRTRKTRH